MARSVDELREHALEMAGAVGALVARLHRVRLGLAPVPHDAHTSHARALLERIHGRAPSDDDVTTLNACLVLHIDHAINPSTLACRVVASTEAELTSIVTAALCALEGPLHGGATTAVLDMLHEVGDVDHVDAFLAQRRASKRKIAGFGHPIYRVLDPRARILRDLADRASARAGERRWFDITRAIEERMQARGYYANVDLYAATTYAALGLPASLCSPMFAAARAVAWSAHAIEQRTRGRILSPIAGYDGPTPRSL
jgi:citrate synthase